jgi:hypothetical protein
MSPLRVSGTAFQTGISGRSIKLTEAKQIRGNQNTEKQRNSHHSDPARRHSSMINPFRSVAQSKVPSESITHTIGM